MVSKFSGALARLKDPVAPEPAPDPVAETLSHPPPAEVPRPMGRPPGKRSDPDWAPRTILMRKSTHKNTTRQLLDTDDERDLSELVDELLRGWLHKQP